MDTPIPSAATRPRPLPRVSAPSLPQRSLLLSLILQMRPRPKLLPPASSSLLYTLKSTIAAVPFQIGCDAADRSKCCARDSGDGSSCRFLALLALYPLVLPLFSLHPSLFADFW